MTQTVGTGGTATYAYNGDGLKIQRVGPDGTTRYYYDGFRSIWETDGIGTMTAELDRDIFGNLLSRLDSSGTRRYYHTDGLGSTIVLTDAGGNFAAGMLYDAWGNVRASSADVGKYCFTGGEMDTASGLYHMGARFYDPSIGRWLSEDPVQNLFEPVSLNFYAYVASGDPPPLSWRTVRTATNGGEIWKITKTAIGANSSHQRTIANGSERPSRRASQAEGRGF